jgi:hypothetical protein
MHYKFHGTGGVNPLVVRALSEMKLNFISPLAR